MMKGFRAEILERTGRTLDEVRPMRRMVEGLPVARERAVSAPMEPELGPVMRTENVSTIACELKRGRFTCFADERRGEGSYDFITCGVFVEGRHFDSFESCK